MRYSLAGGEELGKIAATMREQFAPPLMMARVSLRFRAAAKPVVPAIISNILSIPTTGTKHTGLRIRLARCVTLRSRLRGDQAGVIVYMDVNKMPTGEYSLPAMMEGFKRWRHPLFGDRERWYPQDSHPYFYTGAAPLGPACRAAVGEVLDQVTAELMAVR